MFFHHALCILGLATNLAFDTAADYTLLGMFCGEMSNSFYQAKAVIRALGKRYTRAHAVAENGYFITFFFGRFVMGTPVLYATITCEENYANYKLGWLAMILQWYSLIY